MKVGAVIVTYNSAADIEACVQSFNHQLIDKGEVDYLTVVVDNASKDSSAKIATKFASHVIQNNVNRGFSVAVNQGIRWLQNNNADYLLILNPDAVLKPGAIKNLLSVLDSSPSIGAVGPKMVDSNNLDVNKGYYLKAPSALTVTFFSTFLRPWALKKAWLVGQYEENLTDRIQDVDQIPGAAIFTSAEKLEAIGLLSEAFSIWFEDVEWCYRARKKGFRMVFVPKAEFIHEGGVSFAKWNDINKAITFYTSMKTFFRMHKPVSLPFVMLTIVGNALFVGLKNKDRSQLVFIKRFLKQKRGLLPD